MLTSPTPLIPHPSRAFSLIEAAIVLAITGLVLGAIWLTSASVLENRNAAKTAEGILYIANQIQRKLTQNDTYGSITNINSTGIEMGLFPVDWVSGTRVLVPGGGAAALLVWQSGAITIQLQGFKRSQCLKLLQKLSSLGEQRTKFIRAVYDVYGVLWVNFPLPANPSSTYCTGTPTSSLEVHFAL